MIIYPEGTRGHSFELGKGKVGVAKMALWSKTPVVPMGIYGTHLLMPKGSHTPRIKRLVEVRIGKPMRFDDYIGREEDPQALREITDRIMSEIASLLDQEYKTTPSTPQSTSP